MRVKLQLVICNDTGDEETVTDVITLNKHHQRIEHLGVPGVMAGKFTLGHYDPRSNGDQTRVLNTSADPPNCL
jgi:hypothetical protein